MILVFKDNRSPSLSDTIKVDGVAFDLTGSSVQFRMRPEPGTVLKVNTAAVVVSPLAGTVRYDWAAGDVDTPGDYIGWWSVTLASGKTQDTDEFRVRVLDHNDGSSNLCNLYDVRDRMESEDTDRSRDGLIETLIPIASEAIMAEFEREFGPATASATRRFRVDPTSFAKRMLFVELAPYDLRAATTITLHPEQSGLSQMLTLGADYVQEPEPSKYGVYTHLKLRGDLNLNSLVANTFGFAYLDVAGAWGFATVPPKIVQATASTVISWLPRLVSALAVEGLDNLGHIVAPSTWGIPPDARRLAESFRRRPNIY